jgi:hypothetical protein
LLHGLLIPFVNLKPNERVAGFCATGQAGDGSHQGIIIDWWRTSTVRRRDMTHDDQMSEIYGRGRVLAAWPGHHAGVP